MKLNKKILREMILEVLTEEDVMDKKIKYKDKEGNEKEATVGGVLKQGEDHPGYKKAKQMTDKGGEDKPKTKQTKISADPFAKDDDSSDDTSKDDSDSEPFDSGGPSYANVPKGAKTTRQAIDMIDDEKSFKKKFDIVKTHADKTHDAISKLWDVQDEEWDYDNSPDDDEEYRKWENEKFEWDEAFSEIQSLVVDDPNDGSYQEDDEIAKLVTKSYYKRLKKLSPLARKLLNKYGGEKTKKESIKLKLKREFKEYELYNKNLRKL